MTELSKIEWTDSTANFWWGCFKVSAGCQHCYAETLANRYGKKIWGSPKSSSRELKKAIWKELPKWNRQAESEGKRRRVFVQSMSDFFEDHPHVTEWRQDALALMQECTWIDFQVLTKRPENVIEMIETSSSHSFSDADMWFSNYPHVQIGTSVENQETADLRIPALLKIPAKVRFLSCEPLLGAIDLWRECEIKGDPAIPYIVVDWVIVGGESGKGARPFDLKWAYSIIEQCKEAGTAVFVKQLGSKPVNVPAGYTITGKGGDWDEWPEGLRVREFPT
jgi:protein gp37